MDKRALIKTFEEVIASDLKVLTESAVQAREAAIHAESRAEDQYDTRGLEASYLAGAQSKRAAELESLLNQYRYIEIRDFAPGDAIASTAVIEVAAGEGKSNTYLMMPAGGGLSAEFADRKVTIVTPSSPLGRSLLGRRAGEEISVVVRGVEKDCEIISVK